MTPRARFQTSRETVANDNSACRPSKSAKSWHAANSCRSVISPCSDIVAARQKNKTSPGPNKPNSLPPEHAIYTCPVTHCGGQTVKNANRVIDSLCRHKMTSSAFPAFICAWHSVLRYPPRDFASPAAVAPVSSTGKQLPSSVPQVALPLIPGRIRAIVR